MRKKSTTTTASLSPPAVAPVEALRVVAAVELLLWFRSHLTYAGGGLVNFCPESVHPLWCLRQPPVTVNAWTSIAKLCHCCCLQARTLIHSQLVSLQSTYNAYNVSVTTLTMVMSTDRRRSFPAIFTTQSCPRGLIFSWWGSYGLCLT